MEDTKFAKKNIQGRNEVSDSDTVFSDDTQDILFMTEENSWWFQYRAKVITGVMELFFYKTLKTVDVGGGNGYTTMVAKQKGFDMALVEPSKGACKNAVKRGIDAYVGMVTDDYPNDGEYKQVLLLDVLEHIDDDCGFLGLLNRKIEARGLLLITVPAHMCLWSSEDDYAKHFRRYTQRELNEKAERAGFNVLYSSYFMSFLFLPILFFRVGLEKVGILKPQSERSDSERAIMLKKQFEIKKGGILAHFLHFLERVEYSKIMKEHKRSFGASLIIVIQRRD